ncbi:MAG: hypothetical protein KGQ43_01860 [Acidobacteria bacterium]|nr:hypothetical protein [Acidobacteriota bacterium]
MRIAKLLPVLGVVLSVATTSVVNSVQASAALPSGASNFVPVIDLGSALGDLATLASTPCKVGSSNINELKAGDSLTLPATDLMKALAVANELKAKSDSLVDLTCSPSMIVSGSEKSVAGTVTNVALGLSGTFALKCTFRQSLQIDATLRIGSSLPRGASVVVRGADKQIPMTCSMTANFTDGTSITGSVDGFADVGNLKSDSCTGDTRVSCVPLAITAKVTVTSTTGKLAGYTGTGTYTLTPAFTMGSLNENLATLQQAIGKSSVRVSRAVGAASSREGSLNIDFTPGSPRTDIVYPVVAADGSSTVGTGSLIAATGPRKAKCSYALTSGKRSATIVSFVSSTTGVMPTHTVTKKQYDSVRKTLGAKPGSQLSLVVACGKTRATQAVTLG